MDKSYKTLLHAVKFGSILIAILWIIHLYKYTTQQSLTNFGVFPREWDGVIGIFTAPLIHGGWGHLISNSVPLFVTTVIIHFFYKRVAISSFFLIYILTGFSVWLFGRSVYHIGASGVVYGLISFIFWSGIFRRNIKSIVLALVVTILYSGYLGGIVPFKDGISWESHLLGAIVGIFIAFFLKSLIEADEEDINPWAHEEDQELQYYFPRDVFAMTRFERAEAERQRVEALRQAQWDTQRTASDDSHFEQE